MSIKDYRKEISSIDKKLIELLDNRMGLALKIGAIKVKNGLPIIDKAREKEIYDNLYKIQLNNVDNDNLIKIYQKIIEVSSSIQIKKEEKLPVIDLSSPIQKQECIISFLGPSGTYSDQAARSFFINNKTKFIPAPVFSEIFRVVENDKADFGVVPIENSTAGSVGETLDLLVDSNLKVVGEIIEKINHCLISQSQLKLDEIREIYSKNIVFSQCRKFIEEQIPNAELIPTKSTANAVDIIKTKPKSVAIGSELAGKQNNMIILRKGIEDIKNNFTRFFVIGKYKTSPSERDKTSIVFTVKHEPGTLLNALKSFSERNINLTKLESRPLKTTTWNYLFFLDFMGNIDDNVCKDALTELKQSTQMLKILGSYPTTT